MFLGSSCSSSGQGTELCFESHVCAVILPGQENESRRHAYREVGYRRLKTDAFKCEAIELCRSNHFIAAALQCAHVKGCPRWRRYPNTSRRHAEGDMHPQAGEASVALLL